MDTGSAPSIGSPIVTEEEFDPYNFRSRSTSAEDKTSECLTYTPKPLLRNRPTSPTGPMRTDAGPATSTPKDEKYTDVVEPNISSTSSLDSSQISRVRLGSYGTQVRWYYKQTSEEELYF